MPDSEKTVVSIIVELLEKNKLNSRDLAKRIGVPPTSIYSMIRRDSDRIDIKTLKKMADVFGEDLDVFCGEEDYKKRLDLSTEEEQLVELYRITAPEIKPLVFDFMKKPPKPLPKDGQKIVEKLSELNEMGLERLLETAEDMIAGGRYSN